MKNSCRIREDIARGDHCVGSGSMDQMELSVALVMSPRQSSSRALVADSRVVTAQMNNERQQPASTNHSPANFAKKFHRGQNVEAK
jgi:hypothetical protein